MAWLAVVGVLNSLFQTGYLLRLVHYMYARPLKRRLNESRGEPKVLLISDNAAGRISVNRLIDDLSRSSTAKLAFALKEERKRYK